MRPSTSSPARHAHAAPAAKWSPPGGAPRSGVCWDSRARYTHTGELARLGTGGYSLRVRGGVSPTTREVEHAGAARGREPTAHVTAVGAAGVLRLPTRVIAAEAPLPEGPDGRGTGLGSPPHLFLASMFAYVGLNPRADITWVTLPSGEAIRASPRRRWGAARTAIGETDGKASHLPGIVRKAGEAAAGTDARPRRRRARGTVDDLVQSRDHHAGTPPRADPRSRLRGVRVCSGRLDDQHPAGVARRRRPARHLRETMSSSRPACSAASSGCAEPSSCTPAARSFRPICSASRACATTDRPPPP